MQAEFWLSVQTECLTVSLMIWKSISFLVFSLRVVPIIPKSIHVCPSLWSCECLGRKQSGKTEGRATMFAQAAQFSSMRRTCCDSVLCC